MIVARTFVRNAMYCLIVLSLSVGMHATAHAQTEDEKDSLPPIGRGILDGRVYVGTTGIKGDAKSNAEEKILFQRGWFKSFAFEEAGGFRETDYTTQEKGKKYSFHCEQSDVKTGRMVWDGTVTDDSLSATAVWYRPGMDSVLVWTKCWRQKPYDPMHKPLEGKTFIGKMGKTGDSTGTDDVLTFMSGNFMSEASKQYDFTPNPYYANPRYDTIYFTAKLLGPNHTDRSWRGWVYKGRMEAEIEWRGQDSTQSGLLWFKGKEKKK